LRRTDVRRQADRPQAAVLVELRTDVVAGVDGLLARRVHQGVSLGEGRARRHRLVELERAKVLVTKATRSTPEP